MVGLRPILVFSLSLSQAEQLFTRKIFDWNVTILMTQPALLPNYHFIEIMMHFNAYQTVYREHMLNIICICLVYKVATENKYFLAVNPLPNLNNRS